MKLSNEQRKRLRKARDRDVGGTPFANERSTRSANPALSPATKARLLELLRLLKQIHNRLAAEDRYRRIQQIRATTTHDEETAAP